MGIHDDGRASGYLTVPSAGGHGREEQSMGAGGYQSTGLVRHKERRCEYDEWYGLHGSSPYLFLYVTDFGEGYVMKKRKGDEICRFHLEYGESVKGARMLEVSLPGIGTVVRLGRCVWSIVNRLDNSNN